MKELNRSLGSVTAMVAVATIGCGLMLGTASALTAVETTDIQYIRQEEKLARDVYDQLYGVWRIKIFSNIANSERNHIAAMENIMAAYDLVDSTPAERGRFSIPELQALYDDLVEKGNRSLIDALLVGVIIEETDIADLTRSIELSNHEDVKAVYTNLRNGSENHLSAFLRQLDPLYKRLETPTLSADFDGAGFPILSWSSVGPDATGIRVSRRTYRGDQWEIVSDISADITEVTDPAASVGATTYRITVSSDFEEVDSSNLTLLRPFASFEDWAVAARIPKGQEFPGSDPDRDGLTNIFEYLCGGNPIIADTELIDLARTPDGVVFTHLVRALLDDYAIGYEASADLVDWSAISEPVVERFPIGTGIEESRITIPATARTSFLRAAAERL